MTVPDQYPQLPPGVAPYVAGIASEFAAIRHGVEEAVRHLPPVITFPPFPVQDTNFIRPETAPAAATFAAGWANYGSSEAALAYAQVGTRVFLRGTLSNIGGALVAGTQYLMATLPAGIHPVGNEIYGNYCAGPNAPCRIQVDTSGGISVTGAAIGVNGLVSISGINFSLQ